MGALSRWLLGSIWGVWLALPGIALDRSASDLLALYGTCLGLAAAGVAVLWVATLGLRHLSPPARSARQRDPSIGGRQG